MKITIFFFIKISRTFHVVIHVVVGKTGCVCFFFFCRSVRKKRNLGDLEFSPNTYFRINTRKSDGHVFPNDRVSKITENHLLFHGKNVIFFHIRFEFGKTYRHRPEKGIFFVVANAIEVHTIN